MIKIILKNDTTKSSPGSNLGASITREFKANQEIEIGYYKWPGKLYEPGSFGDSAHPNGCECWSFWTNSDIDTALIFVEDEIKMVILSNGYINGDRFVDAPFEVVFE